MIDPIVLQGRIVTFDEQHKVIEKGALYIGADEKIAAVQAASDPPPEGFKDARTLATNGVIYPGLIDLHGHMVYNALSLWSPPGHSDPYTSRYQWPGDASYEEMISDPANALGALAGKALLKYVEVKADDRRHDGGARLGEDGLSIRRLARAQCRVRERSRPARRASTSPPFRCAQTPTTSTTPSTCRQARRSSIT